MQLNHRTGDLSTAVRRPRMIVAAAAVAALAAASFALHTPATHAAQAKVAAVVSHGPKKARGVFGDP